MNLYFSVACGSTKFGNKILNTILMITMHHAIKEVTVSHEGLNYLQDRQETINDTALLLVTRSLFDLFHYVLKTNTTFCRMSQHSLQLHMCTAAMSFSIPFADLLGRHFSGLFVAALLPSASDKVSS